MTRSVGIPDAAVKVAYDAYISDRGISTGEALRAALVAARPYLMPSREQITKALAGKPIIRSADKPKDWRGGLSPEEISDIATELLALLSTSGESREGAES